MASLTSTIHIPKDVLFHELGGEAVLLNLADGKYYGLDDVGTRMWTLLAEQGSLEAAYRAMLEEYDVDAQTLQNDLFALVERLAAQGLLVIE